MIHFQNLQTFILFFPIVKNEVLPWGKITVDNVEFLGIDGSSQ